MEKIASFWSKQPQPIANWTYWKQTVEQELIVNQVAIKVMHTGMIDVVITVNYNTNKQHQPWCSVLITARLNKMTIQAWSPIKVVEIFFIDQSNSLI